MRTNLEVLFSFNLIITASIMQSDDESMSVRVSIFRWKESTCFAWQRPVHFLQGFLLAPGVVSRFLASLSSFLADAL